jgi:hypothetical protein
VPREGSRERVPGRGAGQSKRERGARETIKQREREEEQRRKGNRTSQGLMRKFRKLQGPFCKA